MSLSWRQILIKNNELNEFTQNLEKYIIALKNVKKTSNNHSDMLILDAIIEIHQALIKVSFNQTVRFIFLDTYLLNSDNLDSLNLISPLNPDSIHQLINHAAALEYEKIQELKQTEAFLLKVLLLDFIVSILIVSWSGSTMIGIMILLALIVHLCHVGSFISSNKALQTLIEASDPNHDKPFKSSDQTSHVNHLTLFQLKNAFYDSPQNQALLNLSLHHYAQ